MIFNKIIGIILKQVNGYTKWFIDKIIHSDNKLDTQGTLFIKKIFIKNYNKLFELRPY